MTVTLRGPFFSAGALGVVDDAVTEIKREVTDYAAEAVKDQLYYGHGVRSGKFRSSVTGVLMQSRHGVVYARDAVKGPWLESGTGHRYAPTRFRGYAMFRRGRDRADREDEKIADKVVAGAVRRLN